MVWVQNSESRSLLVDRESQTVHVTQRSLHFRKEHLQLLTEGAYTPLRKQRGQNFGVLSFARVAGSERVLVAIGRGLGSRNVSELAPPSGAIWKGSRIVLPDEAPTVWQDGLVSAVGSHRERAGITLPLRALVVRNSSVCLVIWTIVTTIDLSGRSFGDVSANHLDTLGALVALDVPPPIGPMPSARI